VTVKCFHVCARCYLFACVTPANGPCRYLVCDTVNDDDEPGTPGGGAGAGVAGAGRQSVASRDSAASASSSATFVMDGQRWDFFLVITAGIAGGCRPCLLWLYFALVLCASLVSLLVLCPVASLKVSLSRSWSLYVHLSSFLSAYMSHISPSLSHPLPPVELSLLEYCPSTCHFPCT
jgi:hypothetical protein